MFLNDSHRLNWALKPGFESRRSAYDPVTVTSNSLLLGVPIVAGSNSPTTKTLLQPQGTPAAHGRVIRLSEPEGRGG